MPAQTDILARFPQLHRFVAQRHLKGTFAQFIPGMSESETCRWIGRRLLFWRRGIPPGPRLGIVSSRLGRRLHEKPNWFRMLRAAADHAAADDSSLVVAPETAAAPFVRKCAERFGLRTIPVHISERPSLEEWIEELEQLESPEPMAYPVSVSPGLGPEPDEFTQRLADRATMALSMKLLAFYVRPRGNIFELLRQRLETGSDSATATFIGLGDGLTSPDVARELMDRGALGWHLIPPPPAPKVTVTPRIVTPRIVDVPRDAEWPFLSHWTRGCDGPWPGQPDDEYLEELINGSANADHSPLATLTRILRQRRIEASGRLIRGQTPVVSFTAVPLGAFIQRRHYQRHQRRWDFEPYGIAIRRRWLEQRNVRPVIYGDDQTWESLPPDQRPWFQTRQTRDQRTTWTSEQEWRHLGSLDLRTLTDNDVMLFVPTVADAEHLGQLVSWPVAVLES